MEIIGIIVMFGVIMAIFIFIPMILFGTIEEDKKKRQKNNLEDKREVLVMEKEQIKEDKKKRQKNKLAVTGFVLGIISIGFFDIGIIPILALIFSGIGLYKTKEREENGSVLAIIGLILGSIYTLLYMNAYGHI